MATLNCSRQANGETTHAVEPGTSANEHVDVSFKLKSTCTLNIHSHIAQQQLHSTRPVFSTTSWPQGEHRWTWRVSGGPAEPWVYRHIKAMSKHTLPSVEFGHSLWTTGMNSQTGRGDTSLSHRIRASDHFITPIFQPGSIMLRCHPRCMATTRFNSKQRGKWPLTPAICPPANISWVWGNTLCWTEVVRAFESSDLD